LCGALSGEGSGGGVKSYSYIRGPTFFPNRGSAWSKSGPVCAINYSGRVSALGRIIDLVDLRRPSLSRSERPPFSS